MELIKPNPTSSVTVDLVGNTYENLQKILRYDSEIKKYKGTGETVIGADTPYTDNRLQVNVKLPAGLSTIPVEWIDTPGEVWSRNWAENHPEAWQNLLSQVRNSEGIILILPPYRELPGLKPEYATEFPTRQQWCNRFNRWIELFTYDCPQAKHIIVCLNFADLFCNVNKEAAIISQKNWHQRHEYVSQNYFSLVQSQLKRLSYDHSAFVRCFLTSIYNRNLLELPWFYLASHLA